MRSHLTISCLAVGLALGPAVAMQPGGPTALEEALALLDRLDTERLSVDFDDEPLGRVIDRLDRRSPMTIRADWKALDRLVIDEDAEITLRVDATSLATILAAVAMQLGDEFERPRFEVHAGQVILTTIAATEAMRLTDAYDVRDLIADRETIGRLCETPAPPAPARTPPETQPADEERVEPAEPAEPEAEPDAEPIFPDIGELLRSAPAPRELAPGEELMKLIADHVAPHAWEQFGGSTASISERDGILFISAPPTTHRKLQDALRRLRRAHVTAVTIEVAIVELPRTRVESLMRRHGPSSDRLVRALLADDGSEVIFRTTAAAALDETFASESRDGGGSTRLELLPRFDRPRGLLTVAVGLTASRGEDHRSVETTVTVPFRHGGAVIELAAAEPAETVRLLVLIPGRY